MERRRFLLGVLVAIGSLFIGFERKQSLRKVDVFRDGAWKTVRMRAIKEGERFRLQNVEREWIATSPPQLRNGTWQITAREAELRRV